jgi:hypothetical protein
MIFHKRKTNKKVRTRVMENKKNNLYADPDAVIEEKQSNSTLSVDTMKNKKIEIPVVDENFSNTSFFLRPLVCLLVISFTTMIVLFIYFIVNAPQNINEELKVDPVYQQELPQFTLDPPELSNTVSGNTVDSISVNSTHWLSVPYHTWADRDDYDELRQQAINWARETPLYEKLFQFPSQSGGFTNDPDEFFIWSDEWEQEVINPMFSSILREDIEYAFAIHLHRLIDPIFGGWHDLQLHLYLEHYFDVEFSTYENTLEIINRFQDMFSMELIWEIRTIENLPIKVDLWNYTDNTLVPDREFQEQALNQETFLIGFSGMPKNNQIRINVDYKDNPFENIWRFQVPIVFTAYINDRLDTAEYNGVLSFDMVFNANVNNYLITNVDLRE